MPQTVVAMNIWQRILRTGRYLSESRTKYTAQPTRRARGSSEEQSVARVSCKVLLKLNEPLYVMSSPLGTGGAMSCNTGKWRGLLLNGMTLEVLTKDKGGV